MAKLEIQNAAILLLKEIIAKWPNADGSNVSNYLESILPFTGNKFNRNNLINGIEKVGLIVKYEHVAQAIKIDFEDDRGYLYQVTFDANDFDNLKLQSVEMQCPCCFGEGINDGDKCIICDGDGWGVS